MEPLISVIIPALNEAAGIENTLRSVSRQTPEHEIIVADGGSLDKTAAIASRYGRVIRTPRGRSRQMNAGAAQARGDILLFLHADTLLPPDGLEKVQGTLSDPELAGGAFRLRFDRNTPLLRFYSWFTHLHTPRLCFGDRGCFVRRSVFEELGGYPDLPIFEDIELVCKLHERGGFVFLKKSVTSSARRFRERGPFLQQLQNIYLWARYAIGTDPKTLASWYPYGKQKARTG